MLITGTVLQERYRVVRLLGQGGMGAVYEALDERLHRTVALKETLVETEELRQAFAREARLLANLNHPALPKVNDHFSEGVGQYLVMEYIAGADLAQSLAERGRPFPVETVLAWADELLDALEYLHGHEPPVIHRDIKPANLKLTPKGHIILLDFGLAKGTAGQMTRAATGVSVLGYTPNYAALEQIQGERTSPRSDLYSLAATLYNLLTGHTPVDALKRATEELHDEADPLRPIGALNTDVSTAVGNVLMRALALKPSRRLASAAEMRETLRRAQLQTPAPITRADEAPTIANTAVASFDHVTQASERETVLLPQRNTKEPVRKTTQAGETVTVVAPRTETRRSRLPVYALVGLLAALIAGCAFFIYQTRRAAPQPQQTATTTPNTAQTDAQTAQNLQPVPQATHPTQPTPGAQPTHAPTPDTAAKERARQEQQQRAEQQRTEEEQRAAEAEQRAGEEEAAREREREQAGARGDVPVPLDPRELQALRAQTASMRAQFQAAENEFRQARLALTNAQRDLKRALDLYHAGQGSEAAVNAATSRVSVAAQALGPAQMKYQIQRGVLRDAQRRLERMGGPLQPRGRRINIPPPVPPRLP
ncbi:MAG: protein kinase domain-containing protein [Pyrinomonadaceae bacterium]